MNLGKIIMVIAVNSCACRVVYFDTYGDENFVCGLEYHRQLVMAKNDQKSPFGGKSHHIYANMSILSLFTGVISLL